jgi:hypothetical protein
MVIIEPQDDTTTILRGRNDKEHAHVAFWPCGEAVIRAAAVKGAPDRWIKECALVARDALNNQ